MEVDINDQVAAVELFILANIVIVNKNIHLLLWPNVDGCQPSEGLFSDMQSDTVTCTVNCSVVIDVILTTMNM